MSQNDDRPNLLAGLVDYLEILQMAGLDGFAKVVALPVSPKEIVVSHPITSLTASTNRSVSKR